MNKKKILSLLLVLVLACSLVFGLTACGNTQVNTNTEKPFESYVKDFCKSENEWIDMSDPTFYEGNLYMIKGEYGKNAELIKMSRAGEVISTINLQGYCNWLQAKPVVVKDKIICAVNGIVEAFDINTLKEAWTYNEGLENQVVPYRITVDEKENVVYIGTHQSFTTNGKLIGLNVKDGSKLFVNEKMGGYYYGEGVIVNNYLILPNTNAKGENTIAVFNKKDGKIIDEKVLNTLVETLKNALIESEIVYNNGNLYYTISERDAEKPGLRIASYVLKTEINSNTGKLGVTSSMMLAFVKSDATPVFYKDRMYISSGNGNFSAPEEGKIQVINANNMTEIYSVKTTAITEGTPLVKTEKEGARVYFTTNSIDGKLKYIEDKVGATEGVEKIAYTPEKTQMSMSAVVSDKTGNMFYRLDSGKIVGYCIK